MRKIQRVLLPAFWLFALIAFNPPEPADAQQNEPEVMLPACGIRYPGGYDPNTVGVVDGRVTALTHPEQGPISFHLEAADEVFTVFIAPAWYWKERGVAIANGDRVRVKGSKTMGADGNLYLVAQEITGPGAKSPLILRDTTGKPAWSGCGPRGGERRGR